MREEFSENVSASNSAMSFLVVASVWFFVRCLRVVDGGFPVGGPDHCPDCVGFDRGAQLVDIVLSTFLLGFLNEFSCFWPEEFEVVEISSGGLLIEFA